MPDLLDLFATRIHRQPVGDLDLAELLATCLSVMEDDEAGHAWSEANGYPGYTSYASLTDLPWRMPIFAALVERLDAHVARFADALTFELEDKPLILEDIWINVLPEGGSHSGHIHPHSVISGTIYVALPEGASPIRFEDPRLPMMMAAPPRREGKPFAYVTPEVGDVLLWESWLRHEVPMNMAEDDRVSVSFNYRWG